MTRTEGRRRLLVAPHPHESGGTWHTTVAELPWCPYGRGSVGDSPSQGPSSAWVAPCRRTMVVVALDTWLRMVSSASVVVVLSVLSCFGSVGN